ncbi:MAG: hypothetical protein ACLGG9_03020, partial [Thermoleophilia bacterium]
MSAPTDIDRLLLGGHLGDDLAFRLRTGPGGDPFMLPVGRPAWPYLGAAIARIAESPLVLAAPDDDEARDLAADLVVLLGRSATALWPTRGVAPGGAVGASPHLVGQRARAQGMLGRAGVVVVASAPALSEVVPAGGDEPLELTLGQAITLDEAVDHLALLGYERVGQV